MAEISGDHVRKNEEYCLGSMMMNEDVIPLLLPLLDDTSFIVSTNRIIFEGISSLYKDNKPINAYTVAEFLSKHYQGVVSNISEIYAETSRLHDSTPTSENAIYYANLVKEQAQRRKLKAIGNEIVRFAEDVEHTTDDVVSEAVTHLTSLSLSVQSREFNLVNELKKLEDSIKGRMEGKGSIDRIYSGFPSLDMITGGFVFGEVSIIAANTSQGKSMLVQSIAQYQAFDKELPVIIFSLEMSSTQLLLRMTSSISGVPYLDKVQGKITQAQFEDFQKAKEYISTKPIFIDTHSKTGKQMALATQRFMHTNKSDKCLVVIDYIQLMEITKHLSLYEGTTKNIVEVKNEIATNLNVPVIAVSQVSRHSDLSNRRLSVSSLRNSGSIEESGGLVLLIQKQPTEEDNQTFFGATMDKEKEQFREIEVDVAKNRLGQAGSSVFLRMEPAISRITEM
jgi:replicative DNA helicase